MFLVRKATRSLRTAAEAAKAKLESVLETAKKLDHTLAGRALLVMTLRGDDQVWDKVGPLLDTSFEDSSNEYKSLSEPAAIRKEQAELLADMRNCIEKLYRFKEEPAKESIESVDGNLFVASLAKPKKVKKDLEEEAGPKKRNRLGQRVRREMWEKKYGQKANHLKQEKKLKEKERKKIRSNPNREDLSSHSHANTPSLHPSWAAKIEQQKKLNEAIGDSQRIIFDN